LVRRLYATISGVLGIVTAVSGARHGYSEILQGTARPQGILINAIGGPGCPPAVSVNCLPAMTILPVDFMTVGIVSVIVALVTLIPAILILARKDSGIWLLVLSILLMLVGGGFIPPVVGIAGATLGLLTRKKWGGRRETFRPMI
jgi:hypothetical protein